MNTEGKERLHREVSHQDYLDFVKTNSFVEIEKTRVKIGDAWTIEKYLPPEGYALEGTTVWSFADRGDWATHRGNYRGNFSPYIPRNLISKYTKPGGLVLDQMVGSGTTLVECKLLGRDAIGVDINEQAIMVARDRLNFTYKSEHREPEIRTYVGDAREIDFIGDEKVDLIVTHPPYSTIIKYSSDSLDRDISNLRKLSDFLEAMREVAEESFRVLKSGGHCAILIGDTRRHAHFVPISFRVMQQFLAAGFILKEDIIKLQHNVAANRGRWMAKYYNFYKIMHEHVFVFRKLSKSESPSNFRLSSKS